MFKKLFKLALMFVVLALVIVAPAFAKGTTSTPVTYFECVDLNATDIGKEWFPDGNYHLRDVYYESDILNFSDDRLSGRIYGVERVINANKNGKTIFQGTAMIVLPDDRGVWEGSWVGDGVLGVNWKIDIVLHGKAGEVEGLKAFITTTSDPSYWCANSAGLIVNPGG